MTDEDRYEQISLIVKERMDGESWFDIIFDYIAGDCEGGGGDCLIAEDDESDCDDHEHDKIIPCSCGMESLGGTSGTLDQCYKATTNVGQGLQPIDLAYAIMGLHTGMRDENISKVLKWAEDEIKFEEWSEVKYGE